MWHPDMARIELNPARRVQNLIASMQGHSGIIQMDNGGYIQILLGPEVYNHPGTAEIIGYQVWVKAFGENNIEIEIDPHSIFIYPPDNSYYDSDLEAVVVDLSLPSARELVETDIKRSVAASMGGA